MEAERYRKVCELFTQARDLEVDCRPGFLSRVCGEDADLRAEVERLLAADVQPLDFEFRIGQLDSHGDLRGERIGRYTIHAKIGEGGMGTVYEAEQDTPRRLVALKVIRDPLGRRDLEHRFAREAQVLGKLQHRGIAQIYDAGIADTPRGQVPFLAMELVRGASLTVYVAGLSMPVEDRLELFAAVCDAVDHAHQHGVIHRDLKPANILVSESDDGHPQPKVVDFGVARGMVADTQAITAQTAPGQLIGTLPYMSPEQVGGDPGDLDHRSDVYALGVVLYELLSGRLPYTLAEHGIPEAGRIICEEDPQRLSSVDTAFRGDIDTIVTKALAKDKSDRYQSAAGLAADVRHFLADEPIEARPPSSFYQFRKFARRNRSLVAGIVLAFVGMTCALVVTLVHSSRVRDEVRKQRAIREVLEDLLATADPSPFRLSRMSRSFGPNVRLETLIREVSARLEARGSMDPEVEAAVNYRVGWTLFHVGRWVESRRLLESSYSVRRQLLGDNHEDTLACTAALAWCTTFLGHAEQGRILARRAIDGYRRFHGNAHPTVLLAMTSCAIASNLCGDFDTVESIAREITRIVESAKGELDFAGFVGESLLGEALRAKGDLDAAERLFRGVLSTVEQRTGEQHYVFALCHFELALVAVARGRFQDAHELGDKGVTAITRITGPDSDWVTHFWYPRLLSLGREGRHVEAVLECRSLFERCQKRFGPDNPRALEALDMLIFNTWKSGDHDAARELAREWREIFSRSMKSSDVRPDSGIRVHLRMLEMMGAQDEIESMKTIAKRG